MASETTSSLVLFIAAIAIAGIAAAAMASVVGSFATELRGRGAVVADTIATDIAMVNDPDNLPYDAGNDRFTIYIKNTGTSTLVEGEILILVDGQVGTYTSTLLDGETAWLPGVTAEFTVDSPTAYADGADVRLRVTYNTISDSMHGRVNHT